MIELLGHMLDSRLRIAKFMRRAMNHVFPDHWSFMLGEIALYSFVVLVVTGAFLALFYNASAVEVTYHGPYQPLDGIKISAAYQSVIHLCFGVPAGLLIRQTHHWASLVFIGAIVAHATRLFFTAAYRRPREINWIIGLTLLVLALANGYFGYSLGGDLLSGAGLRIGYAILLSVPIIGTWLSFICLGSTFPSNATIPHMYMMHIFAIPALLGILIAAHIATIWRQYHTNYPGPQRSNRTIVGSRLWPSYAIKSIGLFFLVFAFTTALGGLVQINPVWTYGPYNPLAIVPGAQPDWYLGWVEGAMRLFPAADFRIGGFLVPGVFWPGLVLPVLVFLGLYLYPFFDKIISDDEPHNVLRLPWQQPFNTAVGCAALMFFLVLLFAGGDDVIAIAVGGSVVTVREILRILLFVAPAITGAVAYFLCKRKLERETARRLARESAPRPTVPAQQEVFPSGKK